MKRIARIALVGVLLIGGVVLPVYCKDNAERYWEDEYKQHLLRIKRVVP